jgi:hypothetical protein
MTSLVVLRRHLEIQVLAGAAAAENRGTSM